LKQKNFLHKKTRKIPSKSTTPKLLKNSLLLFSPKSSHKLTNTSILTVYTSAYLPFACINRWTNNNKTEIEKRTTDSLSRMSMYQEFSPIYNFFEKLRRLLSQNILKEWRKKIYATVSRTQFQIEKNTASVRE
jgi:hypothetical protein